MAEIPQRIVCGVVELRVDCMVPPLRGCSELSSIAGIRADTQSNGQADYWFEMCLLRFLSLTVSPFLLDLAALNVDSEVDDSMARLVRYRGGV